MPDNNIMIVEDEEIVAEDIRASVEKMGYFVCATASTGQEAIDKAGLTRPDLILMDIVLKGDMDGVEAARQIKDLYKVPVVYLTAFGETGMVQHAKITEPYGYIIKPFQDRELQIAIEIALYKKQAEAGIQKMERWLATVLKSIGDAVIASDKDRRITFMNAVAEKLTGWGQESAIGKKITEILNIKDQDLSDLEKHLVEKVITEGLIINLIEDRLLIAKDGTEVPITDSVAPIKEDNGETPGSVMIFRDITEHKRTEEALRRSEENFRNSLDDSPLGVRIVTIKGETLYANQTILDIYGYESIEELKKTPAEKRYTPESYAEFQIRRGKRKLGEDLPSEYEISIVRKDRKIRHLQVFRKEVLWDGERQFQVIYQDITKHKQADEERERLQAQLNQAQKIESVGLLAGGVAHDFNNMLGVILGHTEMAIDKIDTGTPILVDLKEIQKAAERSSHLTQKLLAFARKQTVSPKVLNMNETVTPMLNMLERLIGENIQLIWSPSAELWPVKIDPSQVDQILTNLCVNARDAIDGPGKVTIETKNISLDDAYCTSHVDHSPGDYVLLSVSDDGCGMDKEILEKLFEPFFTTKVFGKGTGLGLSMTYGVVKQNGGFIDVCSEPDHGTTFKIYLPRHKGKAESIHSETPGKAVPTGHETVLIVEDEPALLSLGKLILEGQGYRVLTAGTPCEAMRLAEEHTGEIHLLLTDVVMPEMNGRDLAKNLLSLYPYLKRIFMSGYTADVIAQHCVLDEGVYFIQKPFSKKNLIAKVREVLDHE